MESWLLALLTQAGSSMSRGRTAAPTYARLAIDVAGGSSSVAKRLDDKRQAWLPGARGVWNDEYAACLLAYLEAWYGQEIRWIDQPCWAPAAGGGASPQGRSRR